MLLTAEKISKNYGGRQLLDGVSLCVEEGAKLGLIGANGAGKSTLLKILAGREYADAGEIALKQGALISYLGQDSALRDDATVLKQVMEYDRTSGRPIDEYEARRMLTRLGITDFSQKMGALSGGQRKRVALAATLLKPAELLILDEPTNHLDAEMSAWLEDWLIRYTGALLTVTHDRYFLERVCRRIVELSQAKLYFYEANYSKYLELKSQRVEMAEASERKRQALLKRESQWIMRGARARSTKSVDRIARYEALKAEKPPQDEREIAISGPSSRLGNKTIEIEDAAKAYGGRAVIAPFSYTVLRDDRIGVVGKNGAGKTTLLGMIAGEIAPDGGSVRRGETVRVGYFTQEGRELDPALRPYDYICQIASSVRTDEGVFTAAQMLERFLFSADEQYAPISRLSGGGRRRLQLLGILMSAPNILLLDEPTNDLDIATLTVLEDYLISFPGAVIAVSHDRYFLDKLASSIFEVGEGGRVRMFSGNYTDYLAKRAPEQAQPPAAQKERASAQRPERVREPRFSFKEQREYQTIDADIAAVERSLAQLEGEIEAASSDYQKLEALMARKEELNRNLDELTERWCYLNDLAERIAAYKAGSGAQ